MNIHKNARLTHYRREELVAQIHGAGGAGYVAVDGVLSRRAPLRGPMRVAKAVPEGS